jgi:hypothetical protein
LNNAVQERLRLLVEAGATAEVLTLLNSRTSHRYSALYRLDAGLLHRVCLIDKRGGHGMGYKEAINVATSVSQFALRDGEFVSVDTLVDPRLQGLDHKFVLAKSYAAMRVMDASQKPWGLIGHFDMIGRFLPDEELELLRLAARLVYPTCTIWGAPGGDLQG